MTRREIQGLFEAKVATTRQKRAMDQVRLVATNFLTTVEEYVPDCADKSAAFRDVQKVVWQLNHAITHAGERVKLPIELAAGKITDEDVARIKAAEPGTLIRIKKDPDGPTES